MKRQVKFTIASFFVMIMIIIGYLYFNQTNTKQQRIMPIQLFSQEFCVNAVMNYTAMAYALKNGVNCFRTDMTLNNNTEQFVAEISREGGTYLGILDYQTVGAQPSPRGCVSGCNWTLNTWNASIYNALKAYPEVSKWEIYNEPLVGEFVSGYENGSALNYFNMIKSAYRIIKAVEPNASIICFGGAELYPLSDVQVEYNFYSSVWSYGASKYCTAISIHAYALPYYNLTQDVYQNITLKQEYNFTLMLYENLTGKPIWITETGIPSNNFAMGLNLSEQKQAEFATQELLFFSSYSFIKKIYWYNLIGGTGSGADFGLLNSSTLKPKLAWNALVYFVKNET